MATINRQQLIGAAAGAAGATILAAALSFGSVSAQTSPQPTPTRPAQAQGQPQRPQPHRFFEQFLDRLAAKLGISRDTLENALREMQEEARQERRDNRPNVRRPLPVRAGTNLVEIAANVTGLSREEITRQLREGMSLVEVAATTGKGEADLKTAILADAKAKLDAQVAAGRVTRERADLAYAGIEAGLGRMLNAKAPKRQFGGR